MRTCRSPLTTRGLPRRSKRAWLGSGSGFVSGRGSQGHGQAQRQGRYPSRATRGAPAAPLRYTGRARRSLQARLASWEIFGAARTRAAASRTCSSSPHWPAPASSTPIVDAPRLGCPPAVPTNPRVRGRLIDRMDAPRRHRCGCTRQRASVLSARQRASVLSVETASPPHLARRAGDVWG